MNKLLVAALLFIAVFSIPAQTPSPAGSSSAPPTSKVDPEKEKLIRQVLTRTKAAEVAQERILQGLESVKQQMPRVPEKFWEKYRQLISMEELSARLVSVYDKHYTSEDLSELLKFYDSPIGKKVSDETISILRESKDVAQEISKRAAQSVSTDFQAEQLLQQPRAAGSLRAPVLAPASPAVSPTPSPTASAP